MHNMTTRADLGLLKMSRTFCKDHALEAVTFTVGLLGVDFSSVSASAASGSLLKDALKTVIGRQAEIAQPENYVDVVLSRLSPGLSQGHGISVRATVIPPVGSLPSDLVSRLTCSQALGDAVCAAFLAVKGVALLSDVKVEGVSIPKIVRLDIDMLRRDNPEMAGSVHQRPCKNCRGILRLRFNAPARFAERQAQLENLGYEQLMQRAQLCGIAAEATSNGASTEGCKATVNLIIKSEGIIR